MPRIEFGGVSNLVAKVKNTAAGGGVINMAKIVALGISDEEYLQLIAQGRDPVQEKICERNLIQAGILPEEARQVAPLFKKSNLSVNEEALVRSVWLQVLG